MPCGIALVNILFLLLTLTRVAGVKRLVVSVILSVCVFVRTIKPKRLKLQSPNLAQR